VSQNTIIVILFALAFVLLALLPFIHRAWTERRGGTVVVEKPRVEPPTRATPTLEADQGTGPSLLELDSDEPADGAVDETVGGLDDESEAAEAAVEVEVEPEAPAAPVVEKASFRGRLGKARATMSGYVGSILSRKIDNDTWDEIEEALVLADVGVDATLDAVERLRTTVKEQKITDGGQLIEALKVQMKADLQGDRSLRLDDEGTNVWLFVGVNGVGKTTSIGKVGKRLTDEGKSVVMAAGDTFRAAAAEQLGTWAERCGAHFVRGAEGADPSSVIFDGVAAGGSRHVDVVLADTAGRLHNKVNLMEELSKVRRVADRDPGNVTEVLLVIDATTGQNGLAQAKQFAEAVDVTGVILTKLDGSAKGGIVFAIQREMGIPVKLVGLGETADDLIDFDADDFVDALF
jgi:fused signal recognition particle receptor